MKQFHIVTIGCQMNFYDSAIYADYMLESGYIATEDMGSADIILINTCAVRQKSVSKAISYIGQASKYKREKPGTKIGVIGCASSLEQKKLIQQFHVDFVHGALNQTQVPEAFKRLVEIQKNDGTVIGKIDQNKVVSEFVPVTFGCDSFCSYCIVPYVRGRERSIPEKEIIASIEKLIQKGAIEITLLGQNVNHYGIDLKEGETFPSLLSKVASHPLIKRVDFLTSHPKDFDFRILEVIKNSAKIYRHFHLPIQSGDDEILKQMNRGYTIENYLTIIEKIKSTLKEVTLSTDLIVGFPGETEEAFQNSLKIIQKVKFDMVFGAVYSPRPGTKAEKLTGRIPGSVTKQRLNELLAVQRTIANENNQKYIGKEKILFISEIRENNYYVGKTIEEKPILIRSNQPLSLGDEITVKITSFEKRSLVGEILS
jgi:tRNA-2-methylthio-N6-dimethylallyladenosine synthase